MIIVEVFESIIGLVIFREAVAVIVMLAAGLKFQPVGALSVRVRFVPAAKSAVAPSVRRTLPRVV